jgi:formylglycine-generating enzyme
MRFFITGLLLIGFQALAYTQNEGCYTPRRQKGIEAYDSKDYDKAIKRWQAVLENCTDIPYNHDLNAWIAKAEAAKKPVLVTPPSVSTLPYEPDMVFVQGGTFQMGQTDPDVGCTGCSKDELPIHTVTLSSFSIGKYEITQKQWREVMGSDPSGPRLKGCDQCPVEMVSWNDIQDYIQKLNAKIKTSKKYRLPTEAEWEFAARGGNNSNNYKYSGSNTIDNVAWYNSNSDSKTHPIGTKQANELGIYDMSGNVWEWCSDSYDENYYKNYPLQKPKGAQSDSSRVLRGGSWFVNDYYCRFANRGRNEPDVRFSDLGFRLVRD